MIPLPDAFLNNTRELLGEEFPAFLRALEGPAALALRLNPKRAAAEEAALEYVEGAVPWEARGRYLKTGAKPGGSVAHAAGAFYLQEASAMASAAALDARPGEKILDLCAAPGGKSTQLAAALADRGLLVSNDPELPRAKILAGNLERLGAANALVVSALPDRLAKRWPGAFDGVLVDAPCSGEGMFRRDPDARGEWNPAAPEGCARRQAEILDQAAKLVRPGGRLVYSTCTFNALENEGSVLRFLDRHPEFAPEAFELEGVGASEGGMLRLWPHRLRGDGHFVARLRRQGAGAPKGGRSAPLAPRRDRDAAQRLEALAREVCDLPDFLRDMDLFIQGERLYARPAGSPSLDGLRAVSPGLCLARLGRSHIEPEHALAMALPPQLAHRRVELTEEQARAFLRGETLALPGEKGWTLAAWRGMPLGWGKLTDGVLKNHRPRGLRLMY